MSIGLISSEVQLTTKLLFVYFIFLSNNDAQNILIFGKDINTWLIYVLIFLGLTFLAFAGVWMTGFVLERQSGKSIKQPWE